MAAAPAISTARCRSHSPASITWSATAPTHYMARLRTPAGGSTAPVRARSARPNSTALAVLPARPARTRSSRSHRPAVCRVRSMAAVTQPSPLRPARRPAGISTAAAPAMSTERCKSRSPAWIIWSAAAPTRFTAQPPTTIGRLTGLDRARSGRCRSAALPIWWARPTRTTFLPSLRPAALRAISTAAATERWSSTSAPPTILSRTSPDRIPAAKRLTATPSTIPGCCRSSTTARSPTSIIKSATVRRYLAIPSYSTTIRRPAIRSSAIWCCRASVARSKPPISRRRLEAFRSTYPISPNSITAAGPARTRSTLCRSHRTSRRASTSICSARATIRSTMAATCRATGRPTTA